jgi:hypothetical protein
VHDDNWALVWWTHARLTEHEAGDAAVPPWANDEQLSIHGRVDEHRDGVAAHGTAAEPGQAFARYDGRDLVLQPLLRVRLQLGDGRDGADEVAATQGDGQLSNQGFGLAGRAA